MADRSVSLSITSMGPQRLQNVLGHRTYLHQTVDSVMHSQYDFMYDWALEHLISLLSLLIVECGVVRSDCSRMALNGTLNRNRCIIFTPRASLTAAYVLTGSDELSLVELSRYIEAYFCLLNNIIALPSYVLSLW